MKRRFRRNPDVLRLRRMMEEMARLPALPPRGVRIDEIDLGGVPTERITPEGADLGRAILYIHGGGFVAGLPRMYRPMTARMARVLGVPIYVPDYRLAPEHPFPAG